MLSCDGGRNACRVEAERRIQEQAAHFTAMEEEYNQYIGALQEEYYHHIIALQEDQAPNHNVPRVVDVPTWVEYQLLGTKNIDGKRNYNL